MPALRIALVAAVSATALLLSGCTGTNSNTAKGASPGVSAKASAAAVANACAKDVRAKLASDLFNPAFCTVVSGISGDTSATSPTFASGSTVVYDGGSSTSSTAEGTYTGVSAGKKVWTIKTPPGATVTPIMRDGKAAIQSLYITSTKGDAVTKATAKYVVDYYDFNGKKIATFDGLPNTAAIADDGSAVDALNADDSSGQDGTGYITTSDGLYYSDPASNKISFLTSGGWIHTVVGGWQSTPYGQNPYLENRFISAFNEDGFFTDDYDGLEHTLSSDPSFLRFVTYDGKVLWSKKISNDDNSSSSIQVLGKVAHIAYTPYTDGGNANPVEQWIDIESGQPVSSATLASTWKPYQNFNLSTSSPIYVASSGAAVTDVLGSSLGDNAASQTAFSSTGAQRSLDGTSTRNKLGIDGVVGDIFYGQDGLRYNADTDTATVSKTPGDNAYLPVAVATDGGYIAANNHAYFVKFAG